MKYLSLYENMEVYSNEAFRLPYPNISFVNELFNKKLFYREEPAWVKCVYEIPSEAFESTSAVTVLNSSPGYINDYKINGVYGEVEPLRVEEGVEVEVFQLSTMEGTQVYLPTIDACFLTSDLTTETEFILSRPLNETDIIILVLYSNNEFVDLQVGGTVGNFGEDINNMFSFRSDTIYTYSDIFLETIKEQESTYEGMKIGFFIVNSEWNDNPLEAPSLNTTMIGNTLLGGVQKVEVLPSMLDENNKVVIEYSLLEHDNTINNTFRNIDYLKEIDFTRLNQKINSVRRFKINSEAFIDCSVLENVKIGDYINSIGNDAFDGCINLPIYDNAYYADTYCVGAVNTGITSCTIKEGTKWISTYAFYQCSGLTGELVIPNSVTSIGESAFRNCSSLTNVVIPDSVISIGNNAFQGCSKLTSVEIGSGVTSIGESAFRSCLGLESIIVSSGNTVYDSRENCNCIIKTSTNTLISGCKNSFIPDSVTSIGSEAFRNCSSLTSVVIPDSVISIGIDAFSSCTNLESVEIGSGCISIGNFAFDGCSGLTGELVIPNSVTSIGTFAFRGCKGLTSLEIGSGVTSIGQYAFSSCTSLTSVVIPDSVTSIGTSAFEYCTRLTSVEIGSGCISIGASAFNSCSGLTGELVIPNSVTSIGTFAFRGCKGLTSLEIGSGVTSIGASAFDGCTSLTGELVIPDSVIRIGSEAFRNCSSLTSVNIPDSVTSIGTSAFEYCTKLETIVVSSGNTVYDSRENCNCIIETSTNTLIQGCKTSFIPASVTSIGASAFNSCSGLTSVVIPASVTSIGASAFDGCKGLTSVEIGSGCTSIGNHAFYTCSRLKEITCHAVTAPLIYDNTFYYVKSNGTLYVPSGSDYSSWMSTGNYYLGNYGWELQYIS